ncbi:MAG TPA: immunoglobulin domain-containing protein [Anaerohalosphaeraceae bacterium]|nr:immunoglobulin domain-containing protein [Anaerohalosphaeraceae bacterium]
MLKNNLFILFSMIAMGSILHAAVIQENFESQTPPSTNIPPAGWTFVSAATPPQTGTFYEAVSVPGGIAGRVKCDLVLYTLYAPGYLVSTTGLSSDKPFSGSFDLLIEDEGDWSDGLFLFGDILNGHTNNYCMVKWQWRTALNSDAILQKSNYTAAFTTLVQDSTFILTPNQWNHITFEWAPTSDTTGTIKVVTTLPNSTQVTLESTATLPPMTYFGFASANDAIRVDNIAIMGSSPAYDPVPANGSANQGILSGNNASVDLGWKAGLDPNGVALFNPLIKKHYVFMSKDQIQYPNDPNLYYIAAIDQTGSADTLNSYGPLTLKADGSYLWRVDEGLSDGTGGVYPAGDPNNIKGSVWNFTTVKQLALITKHPANLVVSPSETAVFSVEASSVSPMIYAWFKSTDNANNTEADDVTVGTNSNTLMIENAQAENEGYYYCRITNNAPGQTLSNTASLGVKRLMAHYKFDQTTDAAGIYTDAAGSYPANMVNPAYTRTYVAGVDGDAIMMDASSMANAGTWDPSGLTNEITVSCWVKWTGLRGSGTYQGIVGKQDTWATMNKWAWRTDNNAAALRWYRNNIYGPNLTLTADNQWHFLCMTVAGGSAKAFLDGRPAGTAAFSFGTGDTAPIFIGVAENDMTRWFNGAIDDLRIYNYALPAESIVDEYNVRVDPDIAACLYPVDALADINKDCKVTLLDFVELSLGWLDCGIYPASACN